MAKRQLDQGDLPRNYTHTHVVKIVVPSFNRLCKKQWLAALVGSIIVFVWSWFSLMCLPWHQNNLMKFDNETHVADVIRSNTLESGIYVLPNTLHYNDQTSQREIAQGTDLLENGPFVFASVMRNGVGELSAWPFVIAFLIDFAGALIATWLVRQALGLSVRRMILFFALFGLGVGIISQLPEWNWWGFPFMFVFVNILDIFIGWTLAGIGMAYTFRKCFNK